MSRLEPDDVRHIARLAKLRLDDDEVARFTADFAAILGRLERLAAVDTEGVEPLAQPVPTTHRLRPDEPRPGLDRDAALAGAPDHDGETFAAPSTRPASRSRSDGARGEGEDGDREAGTHEVDSNDAGGGGERS